jgi:hypothetical protein
MISWSRGLKVHVPNPHAVNQKPENSKACSKMKKSQKVIGLYTTFRGGVAERRAGFTSSSAMIGVARNEICFQEVYGIFFCRDEKGKFL